MHSANMYGDRVEKRVDFVFGGRYKDHVHFLIQSVPSKSPQEIIRVVKSITVKRVFAEHPEGKKKLWGESFGAMDIL